MKRSRCPLPYLRLCRHLAASLAQLIAQNLPKPILSSLLCVAPKLKEEMVVGAAAASYCSHSPFLARFGIGGSYTVRAVNTRETESTSPSPSPSLFRSQKLTQLDEELRRVDDKAALSLVRDLQGSLEASSALELLGRSILMQSQSIKSFKSHGSSMRPQHTEEARRLTMKNWLKVDSPVLCS